MKKKGQTFRTSASTVALLSIIGLVGLTTVPVAAQSVEQITVTGSRISNGNNLPTPVTVVSAEQLSTLAPASIPDALNKLPEFDSVYTPNQNALSNSRGTGVPGNYLALYGLSAIRTLVLQDGNRVPGTMFDGTIDSDMLPQLLVQRVDIVKGGASAVYGSDAVAGVVNFITDKNFVGIKGLLQAGISDYGDARSARVGLAWGGMVTDHGHLELSAEYTIRDGVPDSSSRPFAKLGVAVVGAGTTANPYVLAYNSRVSNSAPGGLITTGPNTGLQFLDNGTVAPFNPGTPTGTPNVAIGGDGGNKQNQYILPVINKGQFFGRFDNDFGNGLTAYVEARYSLSRSELFNQPLGRQATIYNDNAFLTTPLRAQLFPAGGPNYFNLQHFGDQFARRLSNKSHTGALAVTAGVNGTAWGDFTWDAHYTHGETRTQQNAMNNVNSGRYYAAVDAVVDPVTGKTVCRVSITSPGLYPGCVPLNIFGRNNASQTALQYVSGITYWVANNSLDDFGANLSGTAFSTWAGPVKVAVGGEYRLASLNVTTSVPDNTFNPAGLRLAPFGTMGAGNFGTAATNPFGSYSPNLVAWSNEVQSSGFGSENITEGYVEFDAPVLKDLPAIQMLSVNGAYRYAQYSASGNDISHSNFSANTWKIGMEWQVFDDLKLRATRSRDFRAPTLWDLYQQQSIAPQAVNDRLTGIVFAAPTISGGNPALKPEVARTTTAGVIYTPGWFPGFSASFDYFHFAIDNAVGTVNGADPAIQNVCLASPSGSSPFCSLVQRPISYNSPVAANFPTFVYNLRQNVAHLWVEGADIEANYSADLTDLGSLGGLLNMRLLWTHQPTSKSIAAVVPGAVVSNFSGTATWGTASMPRDKVALSANYTVGNFTINVMERFYSPVRWNANPTLVYNIPDVAAYYQTDLAFSYDLDAAGIIPATAFLNVDNLLNAHGGVISNPTYSFLPGLLYPSLPYASPLGRYFTAGFRFRMD